MATDRPSDPFSLCDHGAFEPEHRRAITLCGHEVELLWLPERAVRHGRPTEDRPPFRPSVAERILREETLWSSDSFALTPNRFPFSKRQLVLWSRHRTREHSPEMLELAFELASQTGGTALVNSIGAAASIPRAHLHIVDDPAEFLASLPTEAWPDRADHPIPAGVTVSRIAAPYPCRMLRIDGSAAGRAEALAHLLHVRTVPAFNLMAHGESAWLFPRSKEEIVGPTFPQALGAAEIWGRWCFLDERAFREANEERLLSALRLGGFALDRPTFNQPTLDGN